MIEGKKVFKTSAVKAYFGSEKLSVDRLKRVKGYSRFDTTADSEVIQNLFSPCSSGLVLRDPFVCILKVENATAVKDSLCCLVVAIVED